MHTSSRSNFAASRATILPPSHLVVRVQIPGAVLGECNVTQFRDVTVLPRPVQQPIPIWVTANPSPVTQATAGDFERSYKRVARLGDGWMTTGKTPAQVREGIQMIRGYAQELSRTLDAKFEVCVYYNINVNEDRDTAFGESKKFLDDYYTVDYHRDFLELWVAMGSPKQCADSIREFLDAGATTITSSNQQ